MWHLGQCRFLKGPADGCSYFFRWNVRGVGRASVEMEVCFPKNPSSRATLPKMMTSENKMYSSIIFHSSRTDPTKRHDQPSIGGLALSASTVQPVHRPWSSFIVLPRGPSRGTLGLAAKGNFFAIYNGVPVGPDNNSQHCVPYSSIRGAQKRPIPFRLAPGCHPPLKSSPALATNLGYPQLALSILSTSHTPPLGVLQENGLLHLLCTCPPDHGRTSPHWAPALVGAPGQILPLHPPIVEGCVLGSGLGCSLVGPCSTICSAPGTSSSVIPNFRKGHGCQGGPW